MKVGVTGGAGFIGSHIVTELVARGHDPVVFDHLARGDGPVMLGDVRDKTAVAELAAHVDGIVHLAAVLGTQETIADPWPAIDTNIVGGVNVLDAARHHNIPAVMASVGNFQMHNTYATTKTCIERLAHQYRDELGVAVVVVRPMNAYGPGQSVAAPFGPGKVRKIMPAFVCRALSSIPIEVYGDGSQISDMIHVTDVAAVFVAGLEQAAAGDVPQHPVEVGPATSTTVLEVAKQVITASGSDVDVVHLPMRPGETPTGYLPPHQVDVVVDYLEALGVDGRVARQVARPLSNRVNADLGSLTAVGIDPDRFVPLDVGVAGTVDWYREHEGLTWRRPA